MERVVQPRPSVASARPRLDVDDGHARLVPDHPTCLHEPVAEVEVLHVDPVALVEEADLVERRSAHEHERAVDGVDRPLRSTRCSVLGQPRGRTRPPADAREVAERAERSWKRPPGRVVERAVLELRAGSPRPRSQDPTP